MRKESYRLKNLFDGKPPKRKRGAPDVNEKVKYEIADLKQKIELQKELLALKKEAQALEQEMRK